MFKEENKLEVKESDNTECLTSGRSEPVKWYMMWKMGGRILGTFFLGTIFSCTNGFSYIWLSTSGDSVSTGSTLADWINCRWKILGKYFHLWAYAVFFLSFPAIQHKNYITILDLCMTCNIQEDVHRWYSNTVLICRKDVSPRSGGSWWHPYTAIGWHRILVVSTHYQLHLHRWRNWFNQGCSWGTDN